MLRLSDEKINIKHWKNLAGSLTKYKVADRFLTEEECEEAVFQSNWELGYRCPNCQFEDGIWSLKTRRMYQCPRCRHQYSVRADNPLKGKRASILNCFKGAEWMIVTIASNKLGLLTIKTFAKTVDLSYRPARTLRLEMFEELKKPLGGFWGRLICTAEVDESLYIGGRLDELLEYYDFDDVKTPFTKLGK